MTNSADLASCESADIKRRILELIEGASSIAISGHTSPDGDALGSVLGLGLSLMMVFPDKDIALLLAYRAEEKADIADYSICIGYGYDKEESVEFRDRLVSRLKEKGYDIDTIPTFQIGATIGVHTGPYPLGIGVVKKSVRE